jgi:hypothetical protein
MQEPGDRPRWLPNLVRRDSPRGVFPDARIRLESGSGVPSGDA